jgi:hypothetical protein
MRPSICATSTHVGPGPVPPRLPDEEGLARSTARASIAWIKVKNRAHAAFSRVLDQFG